MIGRWCSVAVTSGECIGDYASVESRERSGMGCNRHILYEIKDIIMFERKLPWQTRFR
jgi:hypothetical protein